MRLADKIALARAGYKMKEIEALEKEELETPEETKEEEKPETSEQSENETPEGAPDELAELKERLSAFEKEKEDLKKQLEIAQKEIRERDLSGEEVTETLDDIIRDFCKD